MVAAQLGSESTIIKCERLTKAFDQTDASTVVVDGLADGGQKSWQELMRQDEDEESGASASCAQVWDGLHVGRKSHLPVNGLAWFLEAK